VDWQFCAQKRHLHGTQQGKHCYDLPRIGTLDVENGRAVLAEIHESQNIALEHLIAAITTFPVDAYIIVHTFGALPDNLIQDLCNRSP
jgi:4-hydroxy-L-threonine phosphate dehydrogenase PdxA